MDPIPIQEPIEENYENPMLVKLKKELAQIDQLTSLRNKELDIDLKPTMNSL